ncbi:MAG: PD-(D/E)XK nuclease family protein, partial [Armatimonadetes bacterium]|nr:PD-(D/E)XK nuclease family protein [Candidatus Hippobium faecium]
MDNNLTLNPPAWSFSQYSAFCQCRRMYFYNKYWQTMSNRWDVYRLKTLTSIPLLKGEIVHETIKKSIETVINGSLDKDDAIKYFQRRFRTAYNESEKGYWKDPKKYGKKLNEMVCLQEHYYSTENPLEKAKEAEQTGIEALCYLWQSPVWKRICEADEKDFLVIDPDGFPSFELTIPKTDKSITIYAKIDLALKFGNKLRILDWKTGKAEGVDILQLAVYGFYANSVWNYEINDLKFYLCFLGGEGEIVSKDISLPVMKNAYDTILSSFNEMTVLYNCGEPAIENFPKTEKAFYCKSCVYREICYN